MSETFPKIEVYLEEHYLANVDVGLRIFHITFVLQMLFRVEMNSRPMPSLLRQRTFSLGDKVDLVCVSYMTKELGREGGNIFNSSFVI